MSLLSLGVFTCLAILSLCISAGCQDSGVVPEYLKPGRRDYVWTVDTLHVRQGDYSLPVCLWGNASDDVWIGDAGSPGRLWHFDGKSWSHDSVQRSISPLGLWGSSANDIWLMNSFNSIWRFNGARWYEYSRVFVPGFEMVDLQGIYGEEPNNIWAVGAADMEIGGGTGYKGIIMHFNGSQWQFEPIPDIRVGFGVICRDWHERMFFVDGYRFEPTGDTCKIYAYDGGGSLTQIYSDPQLMTIHEIRDRVYFVSRGKIYRYHAGSFQLWKDLSTQNYAGWMAGRSEMDFFGAGNGQEIVHYNGSTVATLFPNHWRIFNMFVVGDSIFVLCVDLDDNNKPYIIHGKLT